MMPARRSNFGEVARLEEQYDKYVRKNSYFCKNHIKHSRALREKMQGFLILNLAVLIDTTKFYMVNLYEKCVRGDVETKRQHFRIYRGEGASWQHFYFFTFSLCTLI